MSKPGRNDPCPCGSGKKYKSCCLAADQQRRSHVLGVVQAADERLHDHEEACHFCYDELIEQSQAVATLVRAERFDEAQAAAEQIIRDFPDLHEGHDRLGMVYEARGDWVAAANCYRKVLEFIRAKPDQFESHFDCVFEDLVAKLDPPPSAS